MTPRAFAAVAAALALGVGLPSARAAEVRVLSGGAVEPGVSAVAAEFERRTADRVSITYATGPAILARVSGGAKAEVLVAPEAVARTLATQRLVQGPPVPVGAVGIGMVVRRGAARPDVSNVEALKRALLGARTLVYNRASTGQYVETMLAKLGLAAQAAARSDRPADGEGVLRRLEFGAEGDIGFAAITEIELARERGEPVDLVAPLPDAVQNRTTYSAAAFPDAAASARAFFDLLTGPEGRRILAAHGVDPPPAPASSNRPLRGPLP